MIVFFHRASLYRAVSELNIQWSIWNEWDLLSTGVFKTLSFWQIGTENVIMQAHMMTQLLVMWLAVISLHCPLPSKPFQVVAVVAVVTIVTQGEVEAPGTVGSEVFTDDVTLLFRSILTFVPPLSIGHIYRISVCKLESWSEVSHLLCQSSSSHGRLVPKRHLRKPNWTTCDLNEHYRRHQS